MKKQRRTAACARALGLTAALVLASGCTLFDDWPNGGLSGSPFTPAQPKAELTVTSYADEITAATDACVPGFTMLWGSVANTGDVPVIDAEIAFDLFGAAGESLGQFRGPIFNGEIDDTDPDNPRAGTLIEVDESGTFTVCTTVPFGRVARTESHTSFTIVDVVLQ